MSSIARELDASGEGASQGASHHSKGSWEFPKVKARSVQFFKETVPIKTTNRFDPLEENAAWGRERVVPREFSHASISMSQGGEESNPEGIWQMPKPTEKSLENNTTTSEYNPFAETMVWGRARSEKNTIPGEHSYSEAVKRRNVENNEIRHFKARLTSWDHQTAERAK